jgi:hypothetical protein
MFGLGQQLEGILVTAVTFLMAFLISGSALAALWFVLQAW